MNTIGTSRRLADTAFPGQPGVAATGGLRPLLVFSVSGQAYALPLGTVQEIVPMAALSRPPGMPALLAGFLNLGGQAIAVLRLDQMFSLPDLTPGLYTPLVIVRLAEGLLALMVEKVSRIVTVFDSAMVPIREQDSFNDCAEGLINSAEGTVLLLSAERLLLEKERQCLANLEAQEQERLGNWEGTAW